MHVLFLGILSDWLYFRRALSVCAVPTSMNLSKRVRTCTRDTRCAVNSARLSRRSYLAKSKRTYIKLQRMNFWRKGTIKKRKGKKKKKRKKKGDKKAIIIREPWNSDSRCAHKMCSALIYRSLDQCPHIPKINVWQEIEAAEVRTLKASTLAFGISHDNKSSELLPLILDYLPKYLHIIAVLVLSVAVCSVLLNALWSFLYVLYLCVSSCVSTNRRISIYAEWHTQHSSSVFQPSGCTGSVIQWPTLIEAAVTAPFTGSRQEIWDSRSHRKKPVDRVDCALHCHRRLLSACCLWNSKSPLTARYVTIPNDWEQSGKEEVDVLAAWHPHWVSVGIVSIVSLKRMW